MNAVPNQKIITIYKAPIVGDKRYSLVDVEVKEHAAQTLDAGAFKLWNYFSDVANGCEFALSRIDVEKYYGIKKRQYDNAVAELIAKGYLLRTHDNKYDFIEKGKQY